MDRTGEFTQLIEHWAARFANDGGVARVDLPHDWHPDEADGFLRALEASIVVVDDASTRCQLPRVHRAAGNPTQPRLLKVTNGRLYWPWREYVIQVGALTSLVLDYGWPVELVGLDPRSGSALDVAGYSSVARDAKMIVAGETKKTARELERLLVEINRASADGLHAVDLGDLDGHKKYRAMLVERAPYFWAVAPGVRRAFEVTYRDGAAILREVPDLPLFEACAGEGRGGAPFLEPRPARGPSAPTIRSSKSARHSSEADSGAPFHGDLAVASFVRAQLPGKARARSYRVDNVTDAYVTLTEMWRRESDGVWVASRKAVTCPVKGLQRLSVRRVLAPVEGTIDSGP